MVSLKCYEKPVFSIVVIILLVSLSSCSQSGQVIKVGVIGPFTGVVSNFGESMRQGLDLALDEFNSEGGIDGNKVELVYEDDKCIDLKSVQTILQKFKDVDEVSGVIGPFCSSPGVIASKFAKENDMIMVTPGDNLGKISERYFSTRYPLADEANSLATYALKNGKKRIAILYLDSDWGKSYKNDIQSFLEKNNGILVEAESYTYENLDVRTQLSKLKDANPDALVVIDGTSGSLFKQVKEIGFDCLILSEWQVETDVSKDADPSLEGVVYFRPKESSSTAFLSAFKAKYAKAPDVISEDSYDAAMVLFDSLKSCKSSDPDCVADHIRELDGLQGSQGPIKFDQKGWTFGKELIPKTVRGGKFVVIE